MKRIIAYYHYQQFDFYRALLLSNFHPRRVQINVLMLPQVKMGYFLMADKFMQLQLCQKKMLTKVTKKRSKKYRKIIEIYIWQEKGWLGRAL